MMGKAVLLSRLNSPDLPGNNPLLPARAARRSCADAAKNTKLPPWPNRSIPPVHAAVLLDFLTRSGLAPALLSVHQLYTCLIYHGCSKQRKYSQKRQLPLISVNSKRFIKQYCTIITFLHSFSVPIVPKASLFNHLLQ